MAGWFAGYAMSVATTVAFTFLIVKTKTRSFIIDRFIAKEVPGMLIAVPMFTGAVIVWTMIGLILGSAFRLGFEDTPGGLGSPSLAFTMVIAILAVFPIPPLLFLSRRLWWLWVGLSVLFLILFGWVVPHLAT